MAINFKEVRILIAVHLFWGAALIGGICAVSAQQKRESLLNRGSAKQSDATLPQVAFGEEQNDTDGYGGLAWGSPRITSPVAEHERFSNCNDWTLLKKIVGAPGTAEFNQYGEFFDPYALPAGLDAFTDSKTNTCYVYFEEKLVFVSTNMQGDYAQVASGLAAKYPVVREIEANSWGDSLNEAVTADDVNGRFTGKLFRRGNTNTRIYLLQQGFPSKTCGACLIYFPNVYFTAIHDRWWANYRDAQQAELEKQQKTQQAIRQADRQRIQ
jgi:hypothetical protein